MKKAFLFLIFLIFAGVVAFIVWFYINAQPPVSINKDFKNFLIVKGSSAGQIGTNLQKSGFIKSALAFKIYTQFSGVSGRIIAGEFRLSPSFNLFQVVGQLLRGPTEIWVTIPEGLRREEIAAKFASGLDRDPTFIAEFLDASKNDEGTLFPDTYLFPKDASPSSVVNKMTRTFGAKTNSLGVSSGLNYQQRIILASILERETKTDEERPVVAGILINRLNAGMPLQVDATVQYAVATSRCKMTVTSCAWWEPVIKPDLEINSRYNTYKFAGLPPTPIANPGLSSINAAFDPTDSNYLYYIHDADGQIHYAKTLEEQNANVRKYLQ